MSSFKILLFQIKSWIFSNYLIVLLCFAIAVLSFPEFDLTYASGIDEPLPWLFNFLADGHFALGKDIIFPHGPFAFLMYPLQMGSNLYIAIVIYLLCPTLFALSIYKVSQLRGDKKFAGVTIVALILMFLSSLQLQLIGLTLCHILLFHWSGKRLHLFSAIFFCVFNLFIKSYGGMICGLIITTEAIYILLIRKDIRTITTLVTAFFVVFFVFWLSLYHTLSGAFDFLIGQYHLSSNNSEAVSFNQENDWLLIFICIALFSCIPLVSKNKTSRYFFLLACLPLFGAWKHAMARGEHVHLGGFLYILSLFIFLFWIINIEKKRLVALLSFLCLGTFALNMVLNEEYPAQKKIALFGSHTPYHLLAHYNAIAAKKNYLTKGNINNKNKFLPDSVLKIIGNNTVDIYPWNYAYIGANKLNWQPRPVIQNYASYTSWLDQRNSDHILSRNSADFVIWESIEKHDNEYKQESIDGRWALNDGPKSIVNFFANYKVVLKTEAYILYKKLDKPLAVKTNPLSAPKKIRYDQWLEVPSGDPDAIVRAKIETGKSVAGAVKSFFYKAEIYYIFYELENRRIYSHRIVPKNSADGVWLNPFIPDHLSETPDSPVKKIKIVCLDENMVSDEIGIQFEEIKYTSDGITVNAPEHCFKRSVTRPYSHLFFALNTTESASNVPYILKHVAAEKTDTVCLSPPLSYAVKAGRETDHIVCRIDSSWRDQNLPYVRFMLEGFVRSSKTSNGLFVIAQDGMIRWSSKIRYQIVEGTGFWNYVCYSEKVFMEQLDPGKSLHFYLANTEGPEQIFIDDFSVRIDRKKY